MYNKVNIKMLLILNIPYMSNRNSTDRVVYSILFFLFRDFVETCPSFRGLFVCLFGSKRAHIFQHKEITSDVSVSVCVFMIHTHACAWMLKEAPDL